MAKGYRYSLIYEAPNGKKTNLSQSRKIKTSRAEVIRKKFPLTQIDAFTTKLSGEEDLKKIFEYFTGEELIGGNFWVEYIQDKQIKRMRVVYADSENLKYFSNNNIGKTFVEATYKYETYVNNLLYCFIIDPALYKYLKKNKYISKYVLGKIEEYLNARDIENEELISFIFRKLKETLTNYKVIRNIEDGIADYRKRQEIRYNENPFAKNANEESGYQYKLF